LVSQGSQAGAHSSLHFGASRALILSNSLTFVLAQGSQQEGAGAAHPLHPLAWMITGAFSPHPTRVTSPPAARAEVSTRNAAFKSKSSLSVTLGTGNWTGYVPTTSNRRRAVAAVKLGREKRTAIPQGRSVPPNRCDTPRMPGLGFCQDSTSRGGDPQLRRTPRKRIVRSAAIHALGNSWTCRNGEHAFL